MRTGHRLLLMRVVEIVLRGTVAMAVAGSAHAASLHWAGGGLDKQAPADPSAACSLFISQPPGSTRPEGYLLRYEGDGVLRFRTTNGEAGRLIGPRGLIGVKAYSDMQCNRDSLDLGPMPPSSNDQLVEVFVESGVHFTIGIVEMSAGRLLDPGFVNSRVTIGSGLFGGAIFVPDIGSCEAWVAGDSLHFRILGIGLQGVTRCILTPLADSVSIPFISVADSAIEGSISISLARRADAIRCCDYYGRCSMTPLPVPLAIKHLLATVIDVAMSADASLTSRMGLSDLPGVERVEYSNGISPGELALSGSDELPLDPNGLVIHVSDPAYIPSVLAAVRNSSGVMSADSQQCVSNVSDIDATDPYWNEQWYLHEVPDPLCGGSVYAQRASYIGVDRAWERPANDPAAPTVRIGFIDSGISSIAYNLDMNHDTDGSAFPKWRSFINPGTVEEKNPSRDPIGHGSKVASVAVAGTSFGGGYGMSGLSLYGVPISLKITTANSSRPDEMVNALDYGSRLEAGGGAECRVINNSNGFPSSLLTETTRLRLARTCRGAWMRGAFLAVSSGNDFFNTDVNPEFMRYPAAFGDLVVAVGAISFTGEVWSSRALFGLSAASTAGSTHGSFLSLVAPGAGVPQMRNDGSIVSLNGSDCIGKFSEELFTPTFCGTSLAAPVVSGAAAFLFALQPTLGNDDVREVLERTASDRGVPGRDAVYGHGQLDLADAARFVSGPNWIAHGQLGNGTTDPMGVVASVPMSLTVQNSEDATLNGSHPAIRHELRGEAQFPTNFVDAPQVWVRKGASRNGGIDGTGHWDDATRLPWGEPLPNFAPNAFAMIFHTYVYELLDLPGRWYPRPPSQVTLAYTAIGEVLVPPSDVPAGGAMALGVRPISNPSRGGMRLIVTGLGKGPTRVEVFDITGRSVCKLFDGASQAEAIELNWQQGRDGREVAPGMYLVRVDQLGRKSGCRVAYLR